MPSSLPQSLTRIRGLAAARKVPFTPQARRKLARLELGLDEADACDVVAMLTAEEAVARLESVTIGVVVDMLLRLIRDLPGSNDYLRDHFA